jgi:hypothetical protein
MNELSKDVARLEQKAEALQALCGELIACWVVNLSRGTLTTENDQMLQEMIQGWRNRMDNACRPTTNQERPAE